MDRVIQAKGLSHYQLNTILKERLMGDVKDITIKEVNGHRYIGAGLESKVPIIIEGVPGNDLASFAKDIYLLVKGNAQDGAGNTMNDGEIIIYGTGGDILAHSMRGGRILVQKGVGSRVGIHMKATPARLPKIIIGGGSGDFLGEYMAGGVIILLRLLNEDLGHHIGTGMHGGRIYIKGEVKEGLLSRRLRRELTTPKEDDLLFQEITRFMEVFNLKGGDLFHQSFTLVTPESSRPYKNLYAC